MLRSTLYRIIKNKEALQLRCTEELEILKRIRRSEYPELEESFVIGMKQYLNDNITLCGLLIKQKAQDFANKLKIENFYGSN